MAIKIMLMPGHAKYFGDPGAVNTNLGLTEYDIVKDVALKVFELDDIDGVDIVLKARNSSYGKLAAEVNEWNPDYLIEIHLNAANDPNIQGTETLYYHSSTKGKNMASIFQKELVKALKYADRGIKPKTKGDRGAALLQGTKCPSVILEGYFLSGIKSKDDTKVTEYATAIINGIKELVKNN